LIGANGSGKSTLAKHAGGLLRPQQGRVLVTGRDTRLISTGELARQVGHVFQNPDHQIFAATVWEEIAFGPRNLGLRPAEVEKRVQAALAAFHLASVADLPPTTLGYGQRRLVTLAAVHAMQPQVLILDEPTAGLDRRLTARLVEWVSELHASGATVVLITHDMRLASLAPRCVVMDHGRVVLDGPTAQVFTHLPVLAQAGIAPPPIVELSRRLSLPAAPLSLDDFCRAFAQHLNEAGAP
jgi:energy-coupling factor transport system ATP-binding protein